MTTNIWLTSDFHIGHVNIIQYCNRPFTDVNHMNETIIANHNALVKPTDIVIDVGDFAMNEKFVEPTLKRLNGKRTLVCGNHDRCFRSHRHSAYYTRKYLEWGFAEVLQTHSIEIAGQSVRIEHMPYVGDHTKNERYAEWRPKDDGRWLVHGHVHELFKQRDRMINVGVDVRDFKPIHIDEIAAIVAKGPVDVS